MYKVIAIIGESGSGKDTILTHICNRFSNKFNKIIPYTTRPIRAGEVDGVQYNFISLKQYNEIKPFIDSCFNEDWHYCYNYNDLSENKVNIGIFNLTQLNLLMKTENIKIVEIYRIKTESNIRLMRSLNRDSSNVDEIVRRYISDTNDFSNLDFDYIDLNNNNEEDIGLCAIAIGWPNYIK